MTSEAGKGSNRRPCLVGREEESLRWDLILRKITREEFDETYKLLIREGKITRKR